MFDCRKPIKIFVRNGEVRCGPKVDPGFFPVFSVEREEDALILIDDLPWACTDTLVSYAKRLEGWSLLKVGTAKEVRTMDDFSNKMNSHPNSSFLGIDFREGS